MFPNNLLHKNIDSYLSLSNEIIQSNKKLNMLPHAASIHYCDIVIKKLSVKRNKQSFAVSQEKE